MADEQPKVEQTTNETVSHETTEKEQQKQETETPVNKFSEEQVNEIVKARLAKDRASMYNKLGVEDLDTAINAVKLQKKAIKKDNIEIIPVSCVMYLQPSYSDDRLSALEKRESFVTSCCMLSDEEIDSFMKGDTI